MFNNLSTSLLNHIQTITISRESKLNALNKATLRELNSALTSALTDPDVKGIILTGSGEKAFVAGADIEEFKNMDTEQGTALAREGQASVFNVIENAEKPLIAAINGYALGGGLELALACHIRIASQNARLGLPELSLGLIPGYGGTQRLPRLVGKGKALEMILTGEMLTAEEALDAGLVNHVVPSAALLTKAADILQNIFKRSPLAVAAAIRSVNAAVSDTRAGFEKEIAEFGRCFGTADFREGVAAFLSKRTPKF